MHCKWLRVVYLAGRIKKKKKKQGKGVQQIEAGKGHTDTKILSPTADFLHAPSVDNPSYVRSEQLCWIVVDC